MSLRRRNSRAAQAPGWLEPNVRGNRQGVKESAGRWWWWRGRVGRGWGGERERLTGSFVNASPPRRHSPEAVGWARSSDKAGGGGVAADAYLVLAAVALVAVGILLDGGARVCSRCAQRPAGVRASQAKVRGSAGQGSRWGRRCTPVQALNAGDTAAAHSRARARASAGQRRGCNRAPSLGRRPKSGRAAQQHVPFGDGRRARRGAMTPANESVFSGGGPFVGTPRMTTVSPEVTWTTRRGEEGGVSSSAGEKAIEAQCGAVHCPGVAREQPPGVDGQPGGAAGRPRDAAAATRRGRHNEREARSAESG